MRRKLELGSFAFILALSLAGDCLTVSDLQAKSQKLKESEEQSQMKIKFVRTGGYPSSKMGCDIDTKKLPELENRKLHVFIERSGILSVDKQNVINAARKNEYLYQLSVKTGKDKHELTANEASLPVSYGPLIEYLERHSRDLNNKKKYDD